MAIGDLPPPFDSRTADGTPEAVDLYCRVLYSEWVRLLDDPSFRVEANIQMFLERHPCLLPGALGPMGGSGHRPWPSAVFTQPPLPELTTKKPDFMWIATDSAYVHATLIEIERPDKRWMYSDGSGQHSDLTEPISQVASWRRWFQRDGNHGRFRSYFRLPRELCERELRPHFLIVHGRRAETELTVKHRETRIAIEAAQNQDTQLMTFDRLTPLTDSVQFGTVELKSDGGIHAVAVPPSYKILTGDSDTIRETLDLEAAIESCSQMAPARKSTLAKTLSELREHPLPGLRFGVTRWE